jgi:hypothetical protein
MSTSKFKKGAFEKGSVVWLPCQVRGGPFPNERRVYIKTEISEWFGFVNTSELRAKVQEGDDQVRGVVVSVTPDHVVIGVRGQSPASGAIQANPSQITQYGAQQA